MGLNSNRSESTRDMLRMHNIYVPLLRDMLRMHNIYVPLLYVQPGLQFKKLNTQS